MLTKTENISAPSGQIYGHRRQCAAALAGVVNSYRWHATRRTERENIVLRSFTGALMLFGEGPIGAATVAQAAASVAVCVNYIIAAGQILKAGDEELVRAVLRGNVSLITQWKVQSKPAFAFSSKNVTRVSFKSRSVAVAGRLRNSCTYSGVSSLISESRDETQPSASPPWSRVAWFDPTLA
jgi:hypothetical protein